MSQLPDHRRDPLFARIAFQAVWWGQQACIARARENLPGPVVDQEFGTFDSWTHAQAFAVSLNEGLGLDPADAMQILLSAGMACPDFAVTSARGASLTALSPAVLSSRFARRRLLHARLDLAFTLCEVAQTVAPGPAPLRILRSVQASLEAALESCSQLATDEAELELFLSRLRELAATAARVCQLHHLEPFPWLANPAR